MTLILPDPRNDREKLAVALIRTLEKSLPLVPGVRLGAIAYALHSLKCAGAVERDTLLCAAAMILRAIPIFDRGEQWATLTYIDATPCDAADPLGGAYASPIISALQAMHNQATSGRPSAFDELTITTRTVLNDLLIRPAGPVTLSLKHLTAPRAAYAQLRQRLTGL